MNIITETKRYAACPECGGKVGQIDHLAKETIQTTGPWYCKGCGRGWTIRTDGETLCELTSAGLVRWVPATATLVLPPQTKEIVLTLFAHEFERPNKEFGDGARYYYDEHTCPTNWMRDVAEIRIGDNADPHGLFEFRSVERGHLERDEMTGELKPNKPDN